MAKVGAQRASELTGVSKSTIQRAMNTGKISYDVDNGRRLIDVSELERVFGVLPQNDNVSGVSAAVVQSNAVAEAEMALERTRHALEQDRLSMKIRMLEDQLDDARRQLDDMRAQRDLWQKQSTQVLLTSQHSQKQADERIAELQARDEARARAIAEMKARQQAAIQQKQANASMIKKIEPTNQNGAEFTGFFASLFGKKKA